MRCLITYRAFARRAAAVAAAQEPSRRAHRHHASDGRRRRAVQHRSSSVQGRDDSLDRSNRWHPCARPRGGGDGELRWSPPRRIGPA